MACGLASRSWSGGCERRLEEFWSGSCRVAWSNAESRGAQMTLEQLQKQRDKLLAGLGRAESSIEFEQRRTEFRSPDELLTSLAAIDAQIRALRGEDGRRAFVVASRDGTS